MAKKKTTPKTAPKVTEEQVKQASEMIAGEPVKYVPKPKAKKTPDEGKKSENTMTPSPKESKKKVPAFLKDDVQAYVVGTEDYKNLIEDFNNRNATAYNPWRVRPQILYVIWKEQKDFYGVK